ncbi:ATP-dependent nuclease [Tardiphaga sp. 619_E2_N8_5]|uniref:ATP-dependent nuclease n=1 Tax=unclassified Tardiphaga TaxID=2631404 RepID=UPI003F294C37
MRIKKLEVSNYRALRSSSLSFSETTALIGENNCGKSAFLQAIDLFFASSPKIKARDFSDDNIAEPIDITLHFMDFTPDDLENFGENLLDGKLVVTRRFIWDNSKDSGKFFVSARVNPDFSECRNEEGKTAKRDLYKALQEKYDLPKVTNADQIDAVLLAWEEANPEGLQTQKLAGFKGWTNVAIGKLKQKTDFIFIRAVEDAEKTQGDKNSPVRNLIDTIARQAIENSAAFKEFIEGANAKISELTDPEKVPVLAEVSSRLTSMLSTYYKDSAIKASWQPVTQIQPSFPTASIDVVDNNFTTSIDGVGHGLQRAVILTVLQFMAEHRATVGASGETFSVPQSDIILAIEEPEIYQHPTKQRLFSKLLKNLAQGFNTSTGIRIQIVYVTHSPLMVSIAQCEPIRMVRRVAGVINVSEIDLKSCAERSAIVSGRKLEEAWNATQYGAKLHTFRSETAEGFFARCVVLVEGVGDKSVLEAWYKLADRDPNSEGIVIVEVGGKNNLDKPIVVFTALGIPCYWIFDNDVSEAKPKKGHLKANRILQRLAGIKDADCVDAPSGIFEKYAAWDNKLEKYVEKKVGEDKFNSASAAVSSNFHIDADMCLKFPAASSALLLTLKEGGASFDELDKVISAVDALVEA